jgi:hypothetical protein
MTVLIGGVPGPEYTPLGGTELAALIEAWKSDAIVDGELIDAVTEVDKALDAYMVAIGADR